MNRGSGSVVIAVLATLSSAAVHAGAAPTRPAEVPRAAPQPVTGHPRLWVTEDDVARLRSWATDGNPLWSQALLPRLQAAEALMDGGDIARDDQGGDDWTQYPTEAFAELFAFGSLVHPQEVKRRDYATRARTLLMRVIDEAAKGVADDQPWRVPRFAVFNRSRWWGESFPLTVDWIYPTLSAGDKAAIRSVFLRWIDELTNAQVTGEDDHPQPVGVVRDPRLTEDPIRLRWALNNYYTAHLRNIGLMALSFDAADDPDGELTGALARANGAWLFTTDALMRTEARGGMGPEGYEYSPQALAYVMQYLTALHSAGRADPEADGDHVVIERQPFWDLVLPAMYHDLTPRPVSLPDISPGPVYQSAWYGDGERYATFDQIDLLGPLGIHDARTDNASRLAAARWFQLNLAPGGPEQLIDRASRADAPLQTILYFLLFDPQAASPADPREGIPLDFFAEGLGRVRSRTGWGPDATLFDWGLAWQSIDHSHADGLAYQWYRDGEWLTKERTGYGYTVAASEFHNTLALENPPSSTIDPDDWRAPLAKRGSQWLYVADDPPGGKVLAWSATPGYVYALGDATGLYNSKTEGATAVTHASRSIVWLKPDRIVVYDRAATSRGGLFKRSFVHLTAAATVDGKRATVRTPGGQQLVIDTLLPADALVRAETAEDVPDEPAEFDPVTHRLAVEAPGGPADVRFLQVLQASDGGTAADPVTTLASTAGVPYAGAVVGTTAVLFPVSIGGEELDTVTYRVPAATTVQLVTGLVAKRGYTVTERALGDEREVTITAGGSQLADEGGVLAVGSPG